MCRTQERTNGNALRHAVSQHGEALWLHVVADAEETLLPASVDPIRELGLRTGLTDQDGDRDLLACDPVPLWAGMELKQLQHRDVGELVPGLPEAVVGGVPQGVPTDGGLVEPSYEIGAGLLGYQAVDVLARPQPAQAGSLPVHGHVAPAKPFLAGGEEKASVRAEGERDVVARARPRPEEVLAVEILCVAFAATESVARAVRVRDPDLHEWRALSLDEERCMQPALGHLALRQVGVAAADYGRPPLLARPVLVPATVIKRVGGEGLVGISRVEIALHCIQRVIP